ncbi:hypothetical protein OIU78_017178 [Salix suchowensis]|nr:hypothetical protein OIU78_017178 [Salix suchowensis]
MLFRHMLLHHSRRFSSSAALTPPLITPTLLKQCSSVSQVNLIHQQTLVQGLITHFSTNLISTYIAVSSPSHALSLLQNLTPSPSAVYFWNALIRGSIQPGLLNHSLALFRNMWRLGWTPDNYTFPLVFKACGDLMCCRIGASIHGVVFSTGFESNVFVCNAIVAMYGRCGKLDYARKLFDEMCERRVYDLVSWNSIVAVYMQRGDCKNALGLFDGMCKLGDIDMRPDVVSLVNVLPACASMGAWLHGKAVHGIAMRSGSFEDLFVGNALVDMYAKCGMVDVASKVFDRIKEKDVVSWNAMVNGYSQSGRFEDALGLFEKMREENIELNVVSWSAVIAGYAQRGFGCETLDVFREMQVCGSKPNEVTLVSLLSGCASVGALLHGKETHCYAIKCMLNFEGSDLDDDLMVINALIDMYAKCKSINVARTMFDSLEPKGKDVVSWTVMIGGYAQHGEANDALEMFSWMFKQDGFVKPNSFTISCALIACARLAALRLDKTHPQSKQIYEILRVLIQRIKVLGYVPETSFALHDVDDEEKDDLLFEHSEKLALAYGILISAPGAPIRITKNLRVCGDCHNAITYISMIIDHEIILRDSSRFHHFKKGSCSCRGYW